MQRNATKTDWQTQRAYGKEGEQEVLGYLRASGHRVRDVSEAPAYQRLDIDWLINGHLTDLKTDSYPVRNVFLETRSGPNPGCLFKSRAEYWAYYFRTERRLFWIDLPALQCWAVEHLKRYKQLSVSSHNGPNTWESTGYLVPVADLQEAGVMEEDTDFHAALK